MTSVNPLTDPKGIVICLVITILSPSKENNTQSYSTVLSTSRGILYVTNDCNIIEPGIMCCSIKTCKVVGNGDVVGVGVGVLVGVTVGVAVVVDVGVTVGVAVAVCVG